MNQSGRRIAAVTPKKIIKTAVKRNQMRRRIYAAIRQNQPRLRSGFEAVIMLKNGALEASYAELAEQVGAIFVKAGLFK